MRQLTAKSGGTLKTGVATLPDLDKDATDRNRTSPFAFTGNKFEFRMVGSSDSIAPANVVLNTIVAEAFKEAADELEKAEDFDTAVHDMIKKLLRDHKRIIFNGNGYSDAWVEEAERRGLPNITLHGRCYPGPYYREGSKTVRVPSAYLPRQSWSPVLRLSMRHMAR